MASTAKRADAVWYPESDDVGESELQRFIAELLRPLVERWLRAQGRVAHAGADQFFYWVEGDPRFGRAPDVYVVDGVAQDIPEVGSWRTWEGHVPAVAIEVCGDGWQKDYDDAPRDYAAMGAREVIIYDPGATARSRRRVRWQVYRRDAAGRLRRVVVERGDRVWSAMLGCFVREVAERGHQRLRLAMGERGDAIFATDAESERAAREAERAAKEAALDRVRALEEELARLRAG